MRIIAGEAKGRPLVAPKGEDTRPTSEKTRGAIFNILSASIEDAEVLDLFGGTGAMALEALSRGAAHAVVSDNAAPAIAAITRNAQTVLKGSNPRRLTLVKADYKTAIARCAGRRFNLVFLDPPYRMTEAYAEALTRLKELRLLGEGCIIVLERDTTRTVPLPEGFAVQSSRRYGATVIDFVTEVQA